MRRLVAVEAARIMDDQGIRDYFQAKTKAADRLGVKNEAELPKNVEIEQALKERLSLFHGEGHQAHVDQLRRAALEAMHYLDEFTPRLVGPVLEGTADHHSAVCLQVFADAPERFDLFLRERGIPADLIERSIRVNRDQSATYPAYQFTAGGVPMDVTVLPPKLLRQPPISPVTGRPMKRASINTLKEMIQASEVAAGAALQ